MMTPRIAIGVQVHAEPENFRRTLESLSGHTTAPFELVLLGDGPDADVLEALSGMAESDQSTTDTPRGGAACLNRLLERGADISVLLESGTLVGPQWLERLLAALDADPANGIAGPSTNRSWNEQGIFPDDPGTPESIAANASLALERFGPQAHTLAPLYSLGDFCYAVRKEVAGRIGPADEGYGLGPCWEMDYNVRAARAGIRGVWACASYVYRLPFTARRQREESARFEGSRRRYQDKFCGGHLRRRKFDYRTHCRGDECPNFAPSALIRIAPPAAAAAPDPLVSCIMPTANRRQFVPRALRCFFEQDYAKSELIVIDDGGDAVRDLIPDNPRIRYIRTSRLTIGSKRNLACAHARGEIIAHWDDDDWYPPDRLRRQVETLAGGAELCGTSAIYYLDAMRRRGYKYQYGGERPYAVGSSLAYWRRVWFEARFRDWNISEDSQFLWDNAQRRLHDFKDPALLVASLHPKNVAPKNPSGPYWSEEPWAKIRALVDGDAPLISCIMPTRNRRPFLSLALASFAAQTYPRRELVIVDDGADSVEDMVRQCPDVRYIRAPRGSSIGWKRNSACSAAAGELIAHWDDDDWYAPCRLELQAAPLLEGRADITGLVSRLVVQLPAAETWVIDDELHRRMFFGDVHGGTLMYWKSILLSGLKYPEVNLAEDAALLRGALQRGCRLERIDNQDLFVYMRHGANAWKFEAGRFLEPKRWTAGSLPPGMDSAILERYRLAAMDRIAS